MPDGANSTSHLSEEELAELVRGIDHEHIVSLVKQTEYLRRRVFAGFRPSHLPWKQVPRKLAQDAAGHPARESQLLRLWKISNQDLLDEVSSLPTEDLRDAVVMLLVQRGVENRKQILWALRFDERSQVEKALEDGLERDLVEDASGLISQAENSILTDELENTRAQLVESEARRDEAEAEIERLQRLIQRQTDEAQKWREAYDEADKEQAWLKEEINALEEQRQADQETIAELKRQISEEQERVQELRRSVTDLKSSLQAQAEDRDLDATLLELEDERKNSARLRLKVENLRADLQEAFDKRDRAHERVELLRQENKRLEHDKEVIIEQKRRLQKRLEDLQAAVKDLRMQREQQAYEQVLDTMPIENFEAAWHQARKDMHDHIHSVLATLRAEPQAQIEIEKSDLWQAWVEQELDWVEKSLVELSAYPETGDLPDTATIHKAQKLLALRWYLLEHMRQAIQHAEMISFPV
jgi:DNA repair exonuclease SbcCD ATPase subunit